MSQSQSPDHFEYKLWLFSIAAIMSLVLQTCDDYISQILYS